MLHERQRRYSTIHTLELLVCILPYCTVKHLYVYMCVCMSRYVRAYKIHAVDPHFSGLIESGHLDYLDWVMTVQLECFVGGEC